MHRVTAVCVCERERKREKVKDQMPRQKRVHVHMCSCWQACVTANVHFWKAVNNPGFVEMCQLK